MWEKAKNFVGILPKRYLLIALLAVLAILYLRYAPEAVKPHWGVPSPVTIASPPKVVEKIVERIKRVQTPGPPRIVYLDRHELAARLKMPELTNLDNGILVTSVASVPPSDGTTTAVGTLSPTGESQILLRQEPRKFLQIKKEFGVRVGMGTGGLVAGELYARPLRIGPVETEFRAFAHRSDVRGADFGAAIFLDWRF